MNTALQNPKQRIPQQHTNFEQCLKCTVCTVYCPVAKANPLYPGPKQCGPDGERLRLKDATYYDDALKLCTNCKRCETACPSGVNIGDIIAVARKNHEKAPVSPKRLRDYVLSHTDLFGSISAPLAPVVNTLTSVKPVKKLMHHMVGIDEHKSLPKYSRTSFRKWFAAQTESQKQFDEQVCFFHGCYVNYNNPQQGKDFVKVMNAMGVGVQLLKKESCCGVPLIANGYFKKAEKNAQSNVKAMRDLPSPMPVLSTSSTCAFTLKQEYPHVLDVDNSAVADQIFYVTRYLLKRVMEGKKLNLKSTPLRVLYHTPCHLERSGNVIFTLELLKLIPDLDLVVLDSQCCGSAGTYGFKSENYETSMKIGQSLFEQVRAQEADFIVSDCETCKWQLDENTQLETLHPITLLARALAD
ncbi:anaerobic glycerol-3-phosphate dehydrogenase subunit GlpC [Enterovibrio norvegicus]|uniref:anaerobic glycerol-3-phosphate dehydrogenase subunit GlpC n=1 Tax=Enterovibrio norvegicus TaxID=188144 RepID=UPI000C85B356|nr:anaerobic glycerol-3-phosphate dehydrogenase subunit GlpC [Enterovibrio norvegicus]PML80453.1 sn-glycerol-3-phosphate dehydrogenase subunit C [Enterovibrio norvegicus]